MEILKREILTRNPSISFKKSIKFFIFLCLIVSVAFNFFLFHSISGITNKFNDTREHSISIEAGSNPSYIQEWNKIGEEPVHFVITSLLIDTSINVATDNNNNSYIVGSAQDQVTLDYKAFLIKYDVNGTQVWKRVWNGPGWDIGLGVVAIDPNQIYISGRTNSSGAGDFDAFLAKYDLNGNQLWNRTWGYACIDEGYQVAADSNGDIYVTGRTNESGNYDAFLVKYQPDGNQIWNRTWSTPNQDAAYAIAIDLNDSIYITGQTEQPMIDSDIILVKYNVNGSQLWNQTWENSSMDIGYSITTDTDNNTYICGQTKGPSIWTAALLMKYDSDGNNLWNRTWNKIYNAYGTGVSAYKNESCYMIGYYITEAFTYSVSFLKYNSSGYRIWNKTIGEAYLTFYVSGGLTVDNHDNIYLAGYTQSTTILPSTFNIKYGIDTDDDGLTDRLELVYGTSINDPDSDDDGLLDGPEVNIHGTDPKDADSDDDELSDGVEVNTYSTNPNNPDTDGDGYSDKEEIDMGTDPNDPNDPSPINPPPIPGFEGIFVLFALLGIVLIFLKLKISVGNDIII